MQNQNENQIAFSWKLASKFIQFAFEEGPHKAYSREEEQKQNLENESPRKVSKVSEQEQQELSNSYEPSNQLIDFEKVGEQNQPFEISNTGRMIIDEISHSYIFETKEQVPTLTIILKSDSKLITDNQINSDKSNYIELFLAQKSHSNQYQKYKIIKGGIRGIVKHKIKKQLILKFQKNFFNYCSIPQKLPRFILAAYQQCQNKRIYKSIMISDQFVVIDKHKILTLSTPDSFRPYFQLVSPTFLQKTGIMQNQKINLLNKHKIIQEIGTFENYLTKKNKKILNIVYAAHKYSHIIDLYFYNPENKPKKQQFIQRWKQVYQNLKIQQNIPNQKTYNYLHPLAKFILKINFPMRTVRFFTFKQLTKHLSIIATDTDLDLSSKWSKFDDSNQMKQAYIQCYNQMQSKLTSQSTTSKTANANNSQLCPSGQQNIKKNNNHNQKNDDEDFNQDEVEQQDNNSDGEYNAYSSSGYEKCPKKKLKKVHSKKFQELKKSNNRENKYTTRGINRVRNKQDTQDSNQKKNNINKKIKQKQSINNNNNNNNKNNVNNNNVANPPFKVITPTQVGQFKDQQTQAMDNKMINVFPYGMGMNPGMVVGIKKPEDGKGQPGMPGVPKGYGIPMMMPNGVNQQMISMIGGGFMPPGVQVIPMGNGIQALMMPVQMEKNQQPNQGAGFPGVPNVGGLGNFGGMFPIMGPGGIPQVIMSPSMLNQNSQQQQQQNVEKSKTTDADKNKQSGKKQQKKDTFPPQVIQNVDLNQMGMMSQLQNGGLGVMPGTQLGFPMSQFMPMGIPGQVPGGFFGVVPGMPPGMMMNPIFQMQKPSTQNKQQSGTKSNAPTLANPLFGSMPFMTSMPTTSQLPPQMTPNEGSSSNPSQNIPVLPIGMGGQFPPMMQMGQGGLPLGYMMMNAEQLRQMSPQQMQLLMQMMAPKNIQGMMQIPKNDGNDQNKK